MKYLLLLSLLLGLVSARADNDNSDSKTIIAVYDLEGAISESGLSDGGLFGLDAGGKRPLTHFDVVQSLKNAASDEDVKGVVLDLGGAGLSFAQLQEIRRCLMAIRAAEKDVWFYTEQLTNGSAIIGSAANHFTLLPEGNVSFNGIYSESLYFKDLLDKAGLKVDVIHIGDFKSAGETLYRTGPSEYAKKQEDILFDSIFNQILKSVAEGRKIQPKDLQEIIDSGLVTPKQALETSLVDDLQYRTDFITKIRKHYGEDAKFDRSYSLPNLNGPEIKGFMDIMKLAFKSGRDKKRRHDYIAVVALEGAISDASVAPVREQVLKLSKDEKCKALVLRVNSPGGSALSSDVLWEATDEFEATGKPFVVSMGAVAASGGYYVSAGASRIFAEEGTITGSIGVVGMKFILGGTMEKLGIHVHSRQHGKHAGIMSSNRSFSEAEAEIIRKSMLNVYATFKKRITDGRGDKLKGDLDSLAGGRVYSGVDALKVGLVDEIGGLNEAIHHAASLAKMKDYHVYLTPEPKSGLEGLFTDPDKKDYSDEFIGMAPPQKPSTLIQQHMKLHPALGMLPADQRAQLEKLVQRIQYYQNHHILLIGPDITVPSL